MVGARGAGAVVEVTLQNPRPRNCIAKPDNKMACTKELFVKKEIGTRPSGCNTNPENSDREQCPATDPTYTEAMDLCNKECTNWNAKRKTDAGVDCNEKEGDTQVTEAVSQDCCKGYYLKLSGIPNKKFLCKGYNHIGSIATKFDKRTKEDIFSSEVVEPEEDFIISFSVLHTESNVDWTTSTTSVRASGYVALVLTRKPLRCASLACQFNARSPAPTAYMYPTHLRK